MMSSPLLLRHFLERSRQLFAQKEIVSQDYGGLFRYDYGRLYGRVARLANVLAQLGVGPGDRVGTLAWNNHRHLELYFAVPCSGAVLHTVNIRLFRDQLIYVINHAADRVLFVDEDLLPVLEDVAGELKTVEHFVIMTDKQQCPSTRLAPVSLYEDLLAGASPTYAFPEDLDENSAAAMCYTTATTGDPKGVVYSHRGLYLHSLAFLMADVIALSERDAVLPVVPMFHANAWGLPFSAALAGARQVLPGPRPTPASLARLIESEKVTVAAGVPTVWMGLAELLEREEHDLSSLRVAVCGGSAAPRALLEAYDRLGVTIVHAYGMTETTPLATVSRLKSRMEDWPPERQYQVRAKQGWVVPGLEMRVVDGRGQEVAHDGQAMGELWLRGPWVADAYYREPERSREVFAGGWLHTSDIVTVDPDGFIAIVDRSKDLIKSGGEWISSVDLENAIMAHPAVSEAAVIAVPHPKWVERPLACVVLKPAFADQVDEAALLEFLAGKVVRWCLPDRIVFLAEIPKTSVGKFSKKRLRELYTTEAL
ncbi:MAG TPA: long-chain fatty acid--CoA ligase [Spirochaetia bacterium]|nr:long-chain fatty acid--CoA ligase [Spirochaetia bacterium]